MLKRDELRGYQGLQAFHKYWGKKPSEVYQFIIDEFSVPGQTILDPFVGSGVLGHVAMKMNRKFIGIDINPIAVQLTNLLIHPPESGDIRKALQRIERAAKEPIQVSYKTSVGTGIASHYLWDKDNLTSVWTVEGRKKRIEANPGADDLECARLFASYSSRHIRPLQLFDNSRINTRSVLGLSDLFTGRALRNIDLIIDEIKKLEEPHRRPLLLCLTSAIGQMSKMVFAITGRGKTKGEVSTRIEVGSWVIGYWRPEVHFEVNVWNTFSRRVEKFIRGIETAGHDSSSDMFNSRMTPSADGEVIQGDASDVLTSFKPEGIDLIVTDPPHSDRIPYLELSELWNAVLGEQADFENEIVVSNARARSKNAQSYARDLRSVFSQLPGLLKTGGHLVVLFNARDEESWSNLKLAVMGGSELVYLGAFESHYSAGSVVQDNRAGGLQYDYALVFQKPHDVRVLENQNYSNFANRPGWVTHWPAAV